MSYYPTSLPSPLSVAGASVLASPYQPHAGGSAAPAHRRTVSEVESSDMEALEKENFDLKLRLHYLSEKTKAGLPLPNQLYSSLMANAELQSAVQAAEEELEAKNGLLVKARSVIEALNTDMAQAKAQFAAERAQLNTEMNDRVHSAMHSMESQLLAARNQAQDAQAHKLHVDEELQQLRLVLQQMEAGSAQTVQENAHFASELRALAAQIAEKDALLTKQLEVLETMDREHQANLASQLAALAERTVPKEEHATLQHRCTQLGEAHSALEAELAEWKSEAGSREASYRQTSDALHSALAQVDELRIVQAKWEDSQARAHQLDLQLQAALQELDHSKEASAALVATQQAKFEQMLAEDDRRLSDAFAAERAALASEHAAALRTQEEANRAQFSELQDVYNRQLLEARSQQEQQLAKAKAEFEAESAREQADARARTQELEQRLADLARASEETLRRVRDEQEAVRASEAAAHAGELSQLRMDLQEAEHHLAQTQLTHAANLDAMRKDSAQLAQIEAIQAKRAEEKATEAAAAAVREAQAREHAFESERAKLRSEHAAEAEALRGQLAAQQQEFKQQHAHLLASVKEQWRDKEAALREAHATDLERLQQAARLLRAQVDKLEAAMVNEHVPASRHGDLARREAQLREELRAAKQRAADLQLELERARLETVPLAKLHEAEDARDRNARETHSLQQQLQRLQQRPAASASVHPAPPSHAAAHTSPILHLSMYPSSTPSPTHSSVPATTLSSTAVSAALPFSLSTATAAQASQSPDASAPGAVFDLKPALRKLQGENRLLQLQVTSLKRCVGEAAREREEELVERFELEDAQQELEAAFQRLTRREADLRQLRDLLVIGQAHAPARSAGPDGTLESVRELALGSGIAVTSLSPSSSPSPSAASTSSSSEALSSPGAQEELAHEVAKLSRALKTRSSELASSQAKLREMTAALHSAQETLVDRSVVAELEALVEALQREAAVREGHLASLSAQAEQLAASLQASEALIAELRASAAQATDALRVDLQQQLDAVQREAEEHLGRARGEFEQTLAERESEADQARDEQAAQLAQLRQEAQRQLDALREAHASEAAQVSRAQEQLQVRHASELEAGRKDLVHAHELAMERASSEFEARAAAASQAAMEARHRLEEQLAVEQAQASEVAARRSELEAALDKSQTRLARCEEEKQRLELLVATLSQQMAELAAASELGESEFAPLGEALAQALEPPRTSHARPPSHSPTRRPHAHHSPPPSGHRAGGLFSPEPSALGASRGRPRGSSADHSATFQQSFFAASSPYPVGLHGSPPYPHSSLPMSPEHLAVGSVASAGVAALSVAPHVTSITHSMQAIFERSNAAHARLADMQQALDQMQQDLHAQAATHADELRQIEARQAEQAQALGKEKEAYFAEVCSVRAQAEREVSKLEAEIERLRQSSQQSLLAGSEEWRTKEAELIRARDRLEQDLNAASRALDVRAREVDTLKQALATANEEHSQAVVALRSSLQVTSDSSKALDDAKAKLEQRVLSLEASLQAAPTNDSVQTLNDRLHASQLEYARLEASVVGLNKRVQEAEADRSALIALRLAHSTLEQSHEQLAQAHASELDEKRELSRLLDRARAFEAENALLQQRVAQADRRTQVVGADQQLNVQVTRRVLMELCEVLHAAKIPASSSVDASGLRTPSFLNGASFHYPDDAEQAVKWIKGKVHEFTRVRRAFEYTIGEVEEKWRSNFHKLQALLEQRGHEIGVLQRRLLTALGQTATVTGALRWK